MQLVDLAMDLARTCVIQIFTGYQPINFYTYVKVNKWKTIAATKIGDYLHYLYCLIMLRYDWSAVTTKTVTTF